MQRDAIYVGKRLGASEGECFPGPECSLPHARPVNRAGVSEWHVSLFQAFRKWGKV